MDKKFNPNGVGIRNGNFIGLPFTEDNCKTVLLGIPWDVTCSYNGGTAFSPEMILEASTQLDLYDRIAKNTWQNSAIYFAPIDNGLFVLGQHLRKKANKHITLLESGFEGELSSKQAINLEDVNLGCSDMNHFVREETLKHLQKGKKVGLVGGDHSTPLGVHQALNETGINYGILQIDAHADLRIAYEDFEFSHASIMYNILQQNLVKSITSVGIRDICDEEVNRIEEDERLTCFYDWDIQNDLLSGQNWSIICNRIINSLPDNIYISLDMDGLEPSLCPNTGTPVPGGLTWAQFNYLIDGLAKSGKKIIGFDVVEAGNKEWDANVAARAIYLLVNRMV